VLSASAGGGNLDVTLEEPVSLGGPGGAPHLGRRRALQGALHHSLCAPALHESTLLISTAPAHPPHADITAWLIVGLPSGWAGSYFQAIGPGTSIGNNQVKLTVLGSKYIPGWEYRLFASAQNSVGWGARSADPLLVTPPYYPRPVPGRAVGGVPYGRHLHAVLCTACLPRLPTATAHRPRHVSPLP
jgi:hypothetical protein